MFVDWRTFPVVSGGLLAARVSSRLSKIRGHRDGILLAMRKSPENKPVFGNVR
jgi:hypothetical protein